MKFITMNPTVVVSFLTIYSIINIRREVKNFFLLKFIFKNFDIIVFMFTYIMYIYNILLT